MLNQADQIAEIRFAMPADMNEIIVLCKEHADFEQSEYFLENKAELLRAHLFSSDPEIYCFVVELNDKMVGYSTFMKQLSTWDAAFYLYLDCLYLKPGVRNRGIGEEMMNKIKAFAKKENCTEIQWQTPHFNTRAVKFYNRMGAKSKTKERFFWKIE